MDQWFVSLDKDGLRKKCMEEVQSVAFTPDWGKNRIHGFLQSRPDWCISRQRSWGVPIPVFYDEEGEALLDEKIILFLDSANQSAETKRIYDSSKPAPDSIA